MLQPEDGVRTAIARLVRAGWSSAEILAAAAAWKTYFDGPPTEFVNGSRTQRAVEWGADEEGFLARFGVDAATWSARVQSIATREVGDAIDVIGRHLLRGAGGEELRQLVEQVIRASG